MDLDKYKSLTGVTVRPSQENRIKAVIRRTKVILETLLGFSLTPANFYTEIGKVQNQGVYLINDLDNLSPPDSEEGAGYKLFPYNESDEYFHVDPFTNVYKVKLVIPQNDSEFVTVFDLEDISVQYDRDGIGKYIQKFSDWFTWDWYGGRFDYVFTESSNGGMMLAVDADWVDCYPEDIMYVWADMVEHYADQSFNIKSESVDGHSWTKSDTTSPETNAVNRQLLSRYAGPFGSISRNPVR